MELTDKEKQFTILTHYLGRMKDSLNKKNILSYQDLNEIAYHIQFCDDFVGSRFDAIKLHSAEEYFNRCAKQWLDSQQQERGIPDDLRLDLKKTRRYPKLNNYQERKNLPPAPDNPNPQRKWEEDITPGDCRFLRALCINPEIE